MKREKIDKVGVSLAAADEEGRVRISRIHDGYIASTSGGLQVATLRLHCRCMPATSWSQCCSIRGIV